MVVAMPTKGPAAAEPLMDPAMTGAGIEAWPTWLQARLPTESMLGQGIGLGAMGVST